MFQSDKMPKYIKVNGRKGEVVGCYAYPDWHPYLFKAYHIIFKNGDKKTVLVKDVNKEIY